MMADSHESIDLIRLTSVQLQDLLTSGKLTAVDLARESLAQIKRHNEGGLGLKAVISTAPEELVMERAAKLDTERADGKLRGPLHGAPVLSKVCHRGI